MRLLEALHHIKKENLISFHMPGHKGGRLLDTYLESPLTYDITEIPGADNLHDAEGAILETELALAKLYGAEKTRMVVGGSTAGILSAILGTVNRGDHMILNRNAHQSIYNAMEIGGISPLYLAPEFDNGLGIVKSISLEAVKAVLDQSSVLLLTYPTYEGICYPIEEIINLAHDAGVLVIVDEAHGAHLKIFENNPKSALDYGADIVIQSFHKTMPAMTQTACLHFGRHNILTENQKDRVLWYLKVLQTSSPSYVLMASMDAMLRIVEKKGPALANQLSGRINLFYNRMKVLEHFKVARLENQDITKIIIGTETWSGKSLEKKLRDTYRIQVEYATREICLVMTSIATTSEDLSKLEEALIELDQEDPMAECSMDLDYSELYKTISKRENYFMDAFTAKKMPSQSIPILDSAGKISAEYLIPYPPGIPIIVPGEYITEAVLKLAATMTETIKILEVTDE